jgi:quaternary ammonium compound-resistance protein SugE
MEWLYLLIAGLFEVVGVIYLKLSEGFTKRKPLVIAGIAMTGSFLFLTMSLQTIPISIAYGIWTGIGATGSVLIGMFVFRESKNPLKLLLVFGAVAAIVGLKLVS